MPSVVLGATALDEIEPERVSRVSGDMRRSVPEDCDAYLLKWVLMDRSDDEVIEVLTNCRRAMAAGGRVIVVEMLLPEGKAPILPALLDVQMMLLSGRARLRTETEFRDLFGSAGLLMNRCIGTQSPNSIIEGSQGI